jgi:hypothetical protein
MQPGPFFFDQHAGSLLVSDLASVVTVFQFIGSIVFKALTELIYRGQQHAKRITTHKSA